MARYYPTVFNPPFVSTVTSSVVAWFDPVTPVGKGNSRPLFQHVSWATLPFVNFATPTAATLNPVAPALPGFPRPWSQQVSWVTLPPGAFTTTNTTFGGAAFAPDRASPKSPTQQPPSLLLVPGLFTTTNTTFGGDVFTPDRVLLKVPVQQPPSLLLVPGLFTTTNTTFGGDATYPSATRLLKPVQPQGDVLPPGKFLAAPNTTFGAELFSPPAALAPRPRQSIAWGLSFCPVVAPDASRGWESVPSAGAWHPTPAQPQPTIVLVGPYASPNTTGSLAPDAPTILRPQKRQFPGEVAPADRRPIAVVGWECLHVPIVRSVGRQSQLAEAPFPQQELIPAPPSGWDVIHPPGTTRPNAQPPNTQTGDVVSYGAVRHCVHRLYSPIIGVGVY